MHLTLKETATRPAAANVFQQQARFDDFIEEYNRERPHQALAMHTPAERYQPSARVYRGLPDLDYPFHDWSAVVTHCGRICFKGRKINLSHAFAGQLVGVKQVDERIWLVSFRPRHHVVVCDFAHEFSEAERVMKHFDVGACELDTGAVIADPTRMKSNRVPRSTYIYRIAAQFRPQESTPRPCFAMD